MGCRKNGFFFLLFVHKINLDCSFSPHQHSAISMNDHVACACGGREWKWNYKAISSELLALIVSYIYFILYGKFYAF